mmetsp:Transcript_27879/g.53045  ORF Transcript_27879/g.53045 Transcript_27879/m.53045 type:complete len:229 (-) Transcript_27879:1270-1956(-)
MAHEAPDRDNQVLRGGDPDLRGGAHKLLLHVPIRRHFLEQPPVSFQQGDQVGPALGAQDEDARARDAHRRLRAHRRQQRLVDPRLQLGHVHFALDQAHELLRERHLRARLVARLRNLGGVAALGLRLRGHHCFQAIRQRRVDAIPVRQPHHPLQRLGHEDALRGVVGQLRHKRPAVPRPVEAEVGQVQGEPLRHPGSALQVHGGDAAEERAHGGGERGRHLGQQLGPF